MRWTISVLLVLALVAGLWWLEQRQQVELTPSPELELPAQEQAPAPRYPLPEPGRVTTPPVDRDREQPPGDLPPSEAEAESPPLPELADSDAELLESLSGLIGNDFVQRWVKPEFVIERSVALVNSLDGDAPALRIRPLNTLDSEPATRAHADADTLLWTEANSQRYDALVATLESVPPEAAAALYNRYYPLFQQAWVALGESEPYFNDRLVDVIDHLLATPHVELPFEVQLYEGRLHFADPSLQEQSWGRKLLLRMGPSGAGRVKDWLRQFGNELATDSSPAASGSPRRR